jgi:hypothetical protein
MLRELTRDVSLCVELLGMYPHAHADRIGVRFFFIRASEPALQGAG